MPDRTLLQQLVVLHPAAEPALEFWRRHGNEFLDGFGGIVVRQERDYWATGTGAVSVEHGPAGTGGGHRAEVQCALDLLNEAVRAGRLQMVAFDPGSLTDRGAVVPPFRVELTIDRLRPEASELRLPNGQWVMIRLRAPQAEARQQQEDPKRRYIRDHLPPKGEFQAFYNAILTHFGKTPKDRGFGERNVKELIREERERR